MHNMIMNNEWDIGMKIWRLEVRVKPIERIPAPMGAHLVGDILGGSAYINELQSTTNFKGI